MRLAILSDVHGNLPACEAVLQDIERRDVDQILCLGDMVGYGPRPAEVLQLLRQAGARMILGNHDAAVCGMLDYSDFRETAQRIVDWTREELDREAIEYLRSLPYILEGDKWICSHCDLVQPDAFFYLEEETDARASWSVSDTPLLFVGHTHAPMIHLLDTEDGYHQLPAQGLEMDAQERHIINVGSVGFSRDADYRAPYVILDEATRSVSWVRVPYDVAALEADCIARLGSAQEAAHLKAKYDRMPPAENVLTFSPPVRLARSRRAPNPVAKSARSLVWIVGMPLLLLALMLAAIVFASRLASPPAPRGTVGELVMIPPTEAPSPAARPAPPATKPAPSLLDIPFAGPLLMPKAEPNAPVPKATPGSLQHNFEAALEGWQTPRQGVTHSLSAEYAHSGSQSLHIQKPVHAHELAGLEIGTTFPPGQDIRVRLWAFYQGETAAETIRVVMTEADDQGQTEIVLGTLALRQNSWQPFDAIYRPTLDAPNPSLSLHLRYPDQAADIYIDDLTLSPL